LLPVPSAYPYRAQTPGERVLSLSFSGTIATHNSSTIGTHN
jgi:hypothetical protein